MENRQTPKQPQNLPVTDAEWLMIHCDAFISDRDRILLKENAFVIDRDLNTVSAHLPNMERNGKRDIGTTTP